MNTAETINALAAYLHWHTPREVVEDTYRNGTSMHYLREKSIELSRSFPAWVGTLDTDSLARLAAAVDRDAKGEDRG